MEEAARSLGAWENFYVVVGSAAAGLTGLQFVVMALITEARARSSPRVIDAFGTPTIVHFCAVLLVSAIISAPWHALSSVGIALDLCGAAGLVYGVITIRRARLQKGYDPVFEDWLWHAAFPLVAYALLLSAAILLRTHPEGSPFVIGATALMLLFIGIHNAWDTVVYIAAGEWRESENSKPKA